MENADIAHIFRDRDGKIQQPHTLLEHLISTAKLARKFAESFESGLYGEVLGFSHDIGKGRADWQKYIHNNIFGENATLENKVGKIPHAIYGAKIVDENFKERKGRFLSYCIAGHHTGLPDWSQASGSNSSLEYQLNKPLDLDSIRMELVSTIKNFILPNPPWRFDREIDMSLWIRMLFSCLVDADYLDTENYMEPKKHSLRNGYSNIEELFNRYNKYMDDFIKKAEKTPINKIRQNILNQCIAKAKNPKGFFSLTVPTGGGKTLSSLGFALAHANYHKINRIIYVIPYTSIIEQNAQVFRDVLGTDDVVEHHSNLDLDDNSERSRLSCENWDAPFIVTTTVQFFDSLFSSKPGMCRKLHNIVNSVVILDEAQLLPVERLKPILKTMQLLVDHYNVSFVISTATQPAFKESSSGDTKFFGLRGIQEIVSEERDHIIKTLYRVNMTFPNNLDKKVSWDTLAKELSTYSQVLCVVSDRKSCRELYSELHKLRPNDTFHLSALMCGVHRSKKISEIKQRIRDGLEVRVISTQLIEAGVDIDFPVVYRALAGLDSIAQAAGRCNREGTLKSLGEVVVFIPPRASPTGILLKAESVTRDMLPNMENRSIDQTQFEEFFSRLYSKANTLDEGNICNLLKPDKTNFSISFRTVSDRFHIIDSPEQKSIIVRYGHGDQLIEQIKKHGIDRFIQRKAQRFMVNVYTHDFNELLNRGSVEEISPSIFALTSNLEYNEDIGLIIQENLYEPSRYIVL